MGRRSILSYGKELIRIVLSAESAYDIARVYGQTKQPKYPMVIRLRCGRSIKVYDYGDLTTFWHIFGLREYRVKCDDNIIVDLGANLGFFATYARIKAIHSSIFCFEPDPETFSRLEENIEMASLGSHVYLVQGAVAGKSGKRIFDSNPKETSNQRVLADIKERDPACPVTVDVYSLSDALDKTGYDEVDLLKVDVEGAEYELFGAANGETIRRAKRIALEWHWNQPFCLLRERLEALGFVLKSKSRNAPCGQAEFERS